MRKTICWNSKSRAFCRKYEFQPTELSTDMHKALYAWVRKKKTVEIASVSVSKEERSAGLQSWDPRNFVLHSLFSSSSFTSWPDTDSNPLTWATVCTGAWLSCVIVYGYCTLGWMDGRSHALHFMVIFMTIYDFARGKKTNTLVVRDLAIRIQLPAPLSFSRLVSAVFWHCLADAHIFADAFHCRCIYLPGNCVYSNRFITWKAI